MSERDCEQLRRWLKETEESSSNFSFRGTDSDEESIFGVEDRDELEEDHVEDHTVDRSDEVGEKEEDPPELPLNRVVDMEVEPPPQEAPSQGPFVNREFYLGKDRQTRWYLEPQVSTTSRTPRHNIIPTFHRPGPEGKARHAQTPTSSFECIIDNDIITKIVEYTNIYINHIRAQFERERDARHTDNREITALIGILYLAGVLKSGRINVLDMWDNSLGTGIEAVYLTMSVTRFRFLLRCLRFDNINTREQRKSVDKLAAFREVFEKFVNNCKTMYKPTDYLAIDEQLVAFRGNCPFRVYMPSKPAKYGLKIFALVSSSNFYATNLEIYVGQQPVGPFRRGNATQDLVLRLIQPVSGSNRNITCDNWFTSVPLAIKLREENKLTMIGTLRKNKREIPPNFLPEGDRQVKSCVFGFQKNCTLVSYVPKRKKAVLAISTMHDNAAIDPETGDDKKPVIITAYNETKFGVDILDKMCRQYDTARNSRRWPLTLFFHLLNVGGVNALTIYKTNQKIDFLNRRDFLKQLAFDLIKPQIEHRISLESIPREIKTRGRLLLKLDENSGQQHLQAESHSKGAAKHGRCYICGRAKSKFTRKKCEKCQKWVCVAHLRNVCEQCL